MSKSIEIFKIDVCKLPMKKREEFYSLFFEDDECETCNQIKLFLDVDNEGETNLRMAHSMSNEDEGVLVLGLNPYNSSAIKKLLDFISSDENKEIITYADGFEEEDVIKIFYLDMRCYSRAYNRDACRYIVDLVVNHYDRLEKMNFSDGITPVPEDYFSKRKTKLLYVNKDEFNLLLNEGILELGKYTDMDDCSGLEGDEIRYFQWMCGDLRDKPHFEIGVIENDINVFKKIFDKSKEKDLGLEF